MRMSTRHFPLLGIVTALVLFIVAALLYPGGTTDSSHTVGYEWGHNFISSLFAPTALNGARNPARLIAIPAMFVLCLSAAVMYKSVANKVASRGQRMAIEIGGIGSAVYAFFIATPMHDLMINISVPFGLVAQVAILHWLRGTRRSLLFALGVASLALHLLTAAMYYGTLFFSFLPVMQKVSLVASVAWLLAVYYATFDDAMAGRRAGLAFSASTRDA